MNTDFPSVVTRTCLFLPIRGLIAMANDDGLVGGQGRGDANGTPSRWCHHVLSYSHMPVCAFQRIRNGTSATAAYYSPIRTTV